MDPDSEPARRRDEFRTGDSSGRQENADRGGMSGERVTRKPSVPLERPVDSASLGETAVYVF